MDPFRYEASGMGMVGCQHGAGMFPRDVEGVLSWSCPVAWVPSLSLARVCLQHSC